MISVQAQQEIGLAIYAASDYCRTEAHRLIANGAIQGGSHVASRPGEPPNWDTGQLATSITNARTGLLTAETVSNAPYSAALEFGTSRMAARPFMKPAGRNTQKPAEKLVARALKKTTGL
jgi:HK97 gp10 family phage protein